MKESFKIRKADPSEFEAIGRLVSDVYSQLEGFPSPEQLPAYYQQLRNIGEMTVNPAIQLFVAITESNSILGAITYFDDLEFYSSRGVTSSIKNAAGFRFLAVDSKARGLGVGKALIIHCIELARKTNKERLIIHSTKAMAIAWQLYLKVGFKRAEYLDFEGNAINVYGFEIDFDQ